MATKQSLISIPILHETEHLPLKEKLIYFHFFVGNSHWYVAEFDKKNTFFGYVILNGDVQNSEWGYFTLSELAKIDIHSSLVEIDRTWVVQKFENLLDFLQAS